MSEVGEKKHIIKDRCWASAISAIGGIAGVGAAHAITKKRFKRAAVLSTISGVADLFDGKEARRFAKRQPKLAKSRAARGAIEDQLWDKIRNVSISSSLLAVEGLSPKVKSMLGLVILKESVTMVIGGKAIIDHKLQNGSGWPAAIPSSPIGKESMVEFGIGLTVGTVSAAMKESNPKVSEVFGNIAGIMCVAGVARGLQTAPEYMKAKNEMDALTTEEQLEYLPSFYKPHVGTVVVDFVRRNFSHPETLAA